MDWIDRVRDAQRQWVFAPWVSALLLCLVATDLRAATIQYTYDALGHLLSAIQGNQGASEYDYDEVGNRVRLLRGNASTGVGTGDIQLADLDGNGVADLADLAILRGSYGTLPGEPCHVDECDLTGDGAIDERDVQTWFFLAGLPALPGDWAGAPTDQAMDINRIAPDAIVDFYDLCFLAAHWSPGPGKQAAPIGKGIQRHPDPNAALGRDDLAMLAGSWGSGLGPAGAICLPDGDPISAGQDVLPIHTSQPAIKVVSSVQAGDSPRLQVVLDNPPGGLTVFEFTLRRDGGWGAASRVDGPEAIDQVGAVLGAEADVQTERASAEFLQVAIDGELCTIAGARLGTGGYAGENEAVLCSFQVPALPSRQHFSLFEGAMATDQGALFRLVDWEGSIDLIPLPAAPELASYPNPFNPTTEIRFAVPNQANVMVAIYDVRGRRVRLLRQDTMSPGWYVNQWDGRDDRGHAAASGVYMVRLSVDGEHLSRQVTLLR